MKKLGCLIFFLLLFLGMYGQGVGKNWRIDPKRYEDIKGNPYYYQEPIKAQISLHKGKKPFDVTLNVNLYEGMVEVYKEDNDVLIPFAQMISITSEEHPSILFINGKLIAIPYAGEKYSLSDELTVALQIKELYPPGQIIRKKKFIRKNRYTISIEGKEKPFKMNKRSLKRALGSEGYDLALEKNINLKSEDDIVTLLNIMEETY